MPLFITLSNVAVLVLEVNGDYTFLDYGRVDANIFHDYLWSPVHVILPCAIMHYEYEHDFAII